MINKLIEYLWIITGLAIMLGIVVFWSVVSNFFQSNPWYINIAIFLGIGFLMERIYHLHTLWQRRKERKKNG